jgi:uncharacterized protein (TIGR03083 family)
MERTHTLTTDYAVANAAVQLASDISKLTHGEAGRMAAQELERTLALLESLSEEDWHQPTACTLWTVRNMVSHLAGACAGYASWAGFWRYYLQNPYVRGASVPIDGINRRQVEDRAEATPAELIAELRTVGPKAIRTRQRLPWPLRALRLPLGPPLGTVPLGYLTDLIYTRDMWMHRLDICQATERKMAVTADHDGRVVALVMRDLARKLGRQLQDRTVVLDLTGEAGGTYQFGQGAVDSTIEMDAFTFNELASERLTPAAAASRASIQGNRAVGDWFLHNADVPY